jgi:hypothetical protein
VKQKYTSASAVTAVEFPKLQQQMLAEEICMIFLLIDAPEDQLMAYQHTKRSNFITHKGVDKLFGARTMADFLQCNLQDCLGAGDTELDSFLSGVALHKKSNAKGVCQFQPRVSNPGITRVPPDELCKSWPTPTELSISGNQHSPGLKQPWARICELLWSSMSKKDLSDFLCKAKPRCTSPRTV